MDVTFWVELITFGEVLVCWNSLEVSRYMEAAD